MSDTEFYVRAGLFAWLVIMPLLGELLFGLCSKKPTSLGLGAVMGLLWPIGLVVGIVVGVKRLRGQPIPLPSL